MSSPVITCPLVTVRVVTCPDSDSGNLFSECRLPVEGRHDLRTESRVTFGPFDRQTAGDRAETTFEIVEEGDAHPEMKGADPDPSRGVLRDSPPVVVDIGIGRVSPLATEASRADERAELWSFEEVNHAPFLRRFEPPRSAPIVST